MKRTPLLLLIGILLIGLWLRTPTIRSGMPYFYDEDEAHHFNRIVRMVQRGEFDPQYWHKPSFHFYLRMPVVATSFLSSVRAGELRSIKEIVTKDPFGVGDYSFSASHPKIVKWNRAFSVSLSVATIGMVYLIALLLLGQTTPALIAALLTAVSPALIAGAGVIQVDGVMTFMATATALAAVLCQRKFSIGALLLTGLLAGLTISTKYNAAPIAVLPLLLLLTHTASAGAATVRWGKLSLIAALSPVAGFILGSPFLFANIPLFLDQVAYEIWHYGIAGHAGNSGEPGLPQMLFFLNWLSSDGLGFITVGLGLLGVALLSWTRPTHALVTFSFPVLYFIYMAQQRANFTRNLWVLIPFIALGVAALLVHCSKERSLLRKALVTLLLGSGAMLSMTSISVQPDPESRLDAAPLVNKLEGAVALSGELQFEPGIFRVPGRTRVDLSKTSVTELRGSGVRYLVARTTEPSLPLPILQQFPGEQGAQRVVKNPAITIYKLYP